METILSICGAITVVLLGAHLVDYLTSWPRRPFATHEEPVRTERPEDAIGNDLPEPELPYDRAA
jgi:hypothetical protein